MKIRDILEATKGKLIKGKRKAEIKEFCKDTRIIKKGRHIHRDKRRKF